MAEIIFPLNPIIGDVYPVAPDVSIWICADIEPSIWNKIDGDVNYYAKKITTDTVPPSDPSETDQWYNTTNSKMYIWYTDADSSQWVES